MTSFPTTLVPTDVAAPTTALGNVTKNHTDHHQAVDARLGELQSAVRVLSFSFAYNTAGLATGVTVWTPAVGDVLLDAWVVVTTAFDGTTPQADVGTFVGNTEGLVKFAGKGFALFLDIAHDEASGAGFTTAEGFLTSLSSMYISALADNASHNGLAWQSTATATNPLKLVVSQDGTAGGTPIGGAAGAATLYLMVASPGAP